MFGRRKPSLAKGLIAGAAAGIAATLVMDQFQRLLASGKKQYEKKQKLADGESPWQIANEQAYAELQAAHSEGSTEKVARKLAALTGSEIADDQKKTAGQAVHYTFGTLMGLCYAATAEWLPEVTTGGGTAFGTILFLGADEVAVPAFQLSGPPKDVPMESHLEYWAAHVVYGATLEMGRNLIRRLL